MKKNQTKKLIETEIVLVDSPGYYIDKDTEGKYYFAITNSNTKIQTSNILEAAALCVNNKEIPHDMYNLPIIYDTINMEIVLKILSGNTEWDAGNWYCVDWKDVIDTYKNKYSEKIEKIYYTCNTFGELVEKLTVHFNLDIMLNFAIENNFINNKIIND